MTSRDTTVDVAVTVVDVETTSFVFGFGICCGIGATTAEGRCRAATEGGKKPEGRLICFGFTIGTRKTLRYISLMKH